MSLFPNISLTWHQQDEVTKTTYSYKNRILSNDIQKHNTILFSVLMKIISLKRYSQKSVGLHIL